VNNLTLLLRVPMLALLLSLLHVHYLIANVVTLVMLFACRFVVSDRLIWRAPPTEAPAREPHALLHRYDVAGVVAIESEVVLPELDRFATAALDRPAGASPRRRALPRFACSTQCTHTKLGEGAGRIASGLAWPEQGRQQGPRTRR
jgi:hypothetical protein